MSEVVLSAALIHAGSCRSFLKPVLDVVKPADLKHLVFWYTLTSTASMAGSVQFNHRTLLGVILVHYGEFGNAATMFGSDGSKMTECNH